MQLPNQELDLEYGRWLFAQECNFVAATATLDRLPPPNAIEVAFVGRSNVGKSSLINALTNRKTLARTSNTPGRTQELIFFTLTDKLTLVDMPGYGYAKASKSKIHSWNNLIIYYLKGRVNLRRVYVLIDSRHGLKETDKSLMKLLDEAAVSYQIVLTKTDKATTTGLKNLHDSMLIELKKFVASHPEIIMTSANKQEGLDELRATIAELTRT